MTATRCPRARTVGGLAAAALCASLGAATACGNGDGHGATGGGGRGGAVTSKKASPGPGPGVSPHVPAEPPRPLAKLYSLAGDAQVNEGAAARQVGAPLGGGASLRTGGDGVVVVDFRQDARVTVFDDSLAELGRDGPATVVLARGAALAALPPAGNSYRPPLRVVTPEAVVDIGASGEVFIDVHSSGATWVAVLSGDASVSRGERPAQGAVLVRELPPGRSIVVAGELLETVPGPPTLAAARALPAGLWRGRAPEADPARRAADLVALDAALEALATEKARARELADRQRAALRASRTAAADVQREIVAQSADLYRARTVALMCWERAAARALAEGPSGEAVVASRRARAEQVLGRFVP